MSGNLDLRILHFRSFGSYFVSSTVSPSCKASDLKYISKTPSFTLSLQVHYPYVTTLSIYSLEHGRGAVLSLVDKGFPSPIRIENQAGSFHSRENHLFTFSSLSSFYRSFFKGKAPVFFKNPVHADFESVLEFLPSCNISQNI